MIKSELEIIKSIKIIKHVSFMNSIALKNFTNGVYSNTNPVRTIALQIVYHQCEPKSLRKNITQW